MKDDGLALVTSTTQHWVDNSRRTGSCAQWYPKYECPLAAAFDKTKNLILNSVECHHILSNKLSWNGF